MDSLVQPTPDSSYMTPKASWARLRLIWSLVSAQRRLRQTNESSRYPDSLGDRIFRCRLTLGLDYRFDEAKRAEVLEWGRQLVTEFDARKATIFPS